MEIKHTKCEFPIGACDEGLALFEVHHPSPQIISFGGCISFKCLELPNEDSEGLLEITSSQPIETREERTFDRRLALKLFRSSEEAFGPLDLEVVIQLPRGKSLSSLFVETTNSSVFLPSEITDAIFQNVTLKLESGAAVITKPGRVEFKPGTQGDRTLIVKTQNGSIQGEFSLGKLCRLETANGSIKVQAKITVNNQNSNHRLETHTMNGAIDVNIKAVNDQNLSNSDLLNWCNNSFHTTHSSMNGRVQVSFPSRWKGFENHDINTMNGRRTVSFCDREISIQPESMRPSNTNFHYSGTGVVKIGGGARFINTGSGTQFISGLRVVPNESVTRGLRGMTFSNYGTRSINIARDGESSYNNAGTGQIFIGDITNFHRRNLL